jgi:CDP-glucose 4,6-dehydratase
MPGLCAGKAAWSRDGQPQPHEATYLKLDCSKARARLDWQPRWDIGQAIEKIVEWHKAYERRADMRDLTLAQINTYQNT